MSITLVVPTFERPDFVSRMLDYYAANKFAGMIVLADSSAGAALERNRITVGRLTKSLEVKHEVFPATVPFAQKLLAALETVRSPYLAIAADDDFLVPQSLRAACDFLDSHTEYVAAHGHALTFTVQGDGAFGALEISNVYPQRSVVEPTAARRVLAHFQRYTTNFYSVNRTTGAVADYRRTVPLNLDFNFLELLPSGMSVARGKMQKLDVLFMARQVLTRKHYAAKTIFSWITSPEFAPHQEAVVQMLAESISEHDGLRPDEAQQTARDALMCYLADALAQQVGASPAMGPSWRAFPHRFGRALRHIRQRTELRARRSRFADELREIGRATADAIKATSTGGIEASHEVH